MFNILDNLIKNGNPLLIPLPITDSQYPEIKQQFVHSWKHTNKEQPYLYAVYKIVYSQSSLQPYNDYRSKQPGATEELLYHGTNRSCLLAEKTGNVKLCGLPDCSLCTIIRQSFDVKRCGNKHKFSRFGTGIYTSSCSSKADDYVRNMSPKASLRVLVLARVAVGRVKVLQRTDTSLTCPPSGFDSILGLPGQDLNYEESVVYENDAIRPGYILVYGSPPVLKQEAKADWELILRKLFTTPLAP